MPYELECTDCSFRSVVHGEFDSVFEVVEAHQDDSLTHFVNVHRRD